MPDRRVLHVVAHTHWDREWYEPFEAYRFKLVKAVDHLLTTLDTDPGFRHFNFDGQTAAIEDYLDVRPPVEPEVARFVRDGRLAVGPWRILMDEFLCSPETIVRNLQQGRATAMRLGRPMALGYIPDSFGHIAQMPQILRLAGLADACVWRGVPSAVDRTVFRWEAPDGSWVRTFYLATSYSNATALPEQPDELLVRARRIVEDLEPFGPGPVVLAMNGSDHRGAQAGLPEAIAKANAMQDEIELRLGSMEEYAATAPEPAVTWRGEMRSGARANLLPGVLSARIPLKQMEFAASSVLERYAEPLAAIAGTDTGMLLDKSWRALVENSAHDSVCGCGIDAVADQVGERYREAARIADLVASDALAALAGRVDASSIPQGDEGVLVFNPSPRPRGGAVEVTLTPSVPGSRLAFRGPDGTARRAQVIESEPQVLVDMKLRGTQLAKIVPTVNTRQIGALWVNDLRVEPGPTTTVRLTLGPVAEGRFDVEGAKRAVESLIRRKPGARYRVIGEGPALSRVLVPVPPVPGLGWTLVRPVGLEGPEPDAPRAEGNRVWNEHVDARVDGTGRISLEAGGRRFDGLLGIEDGGDAGDEYNYSPPSLDHVVTDPERVEVDAIARGPVEATLRVRRVYRVPAGLASGDRKRSRRTVPLSVVTDLSVRAGEPFLRVTTSVTNQARDHRVRVTLPLPFTAAGSHADGAFHVTERGLVAEGGVHEHGLATFPSRRWVDVTGDGHGLAVFHRGTPEYELVEGRVLAVTLLRSVGWLSRHSTAMRAGGAGPALETPGAQIPGEHRFELALFPHAGDWRDAAIHDVAEAFAYPLRATGVRGHDGSLPPAAGAITMEPACVQLSALHATGEGLVCRIYNASPDAIDATLRFGPPLGVGQASLTDLFGAETGPVEIAGATARLSMRAWEIATLRLSS